MYYYSILITLAITLTLSCASSETNTEKQNSQKADTNITAQSQDTVPQPPQPDLSPGTARIKGHAITIREPEQAENMYRIAIKIIEVMGYGSSTPPIATGDTLTIGSYTLPEDFETGKKFVSIISYRQIMAGTEDTPFWLLVRIEKN